MLPADNLELLLPDAPPARMERARKLITFLRLIADEGRCAPAGSVGLSLERARGELELHTRKRLAAALLDLLRHCLYADAGGDSFAWFGEPGATPQAAWSVVEEGRDELSWLPSVPEPNESAAGVAARLLEALERLGSAPGELALWRARATRCSEGLERGEAVLRELAGRSSDAGLAAAAACGWIECLLDRGAVRAARAALDERPALAASTPRAARLRCWTALLQEDEAAARAVEAGSPAWSGRLPNALAELRTARPDWLPLLAGKAAGSGGAPAASLANASASARALRRHCGALVAGVFVLLEGGQHELLEADFAPALKERGDEWLRGLEGAASESSSPEHLAIVRAEVAALHRQGHGQGHGHGFGHGLGHGAAQGLANSIARGQVLALAVAPVIDEEGEVAGWLRLEWEHHLVPARAHLRRLAARWRERVLAPRAPASPRRGEGAPAQQIDWSGDWSGPSGDGPCAEVIRSLVADLAMKTAQRRWWGFEVAQGRARWIAAGGGTLGEARIAPGPRRALRRALRSSGPVHFDDPEPELALSRDSASGLVLPLASRGELCGLLAIESTRRKDFPPALAQRWLERAQAYAIELRIAQFREWHRANQGHDVHFAAAGPAAPWIEQVFAAARSRSGCALIGPGGSGKRVLARWLHFEGGRAQRPCRFVGCDGDERRLWGDPSASAADAGAATPGTIVLEGIERLSPAGQARLLAQLEQAPLRGQAVEAARWLVLSETPLDQLSCRGTLRADLCRRLERLQIRVPALAERRCELPRLIALVARRFAEEERVAPPSFDDEALALLWRQPWHGNLRELENLLFKVVLLHPGQDVRATDLEALARRFQIELVRRVGSRHPEPELVRAALATTANLRGSINKTRAALYLGWDPDTLVTRMGELGLLERAGDGAPQHPDAGPDAGPDSGAGSM